MKKILKIVLFSCFVAAFFAINTAAGELTSPYSVPFGPVNDGYHMIATYERGSILPWDDATTITDMYVCSNYNTGLAQSWIYNYYDNHQNYSESRTVYANGEIYCACAIDDINACQTWHRAQEYINGDESNKCFDQPYAQNA